MPCAIQTIYYAVQMTLYVVYLFEYAVVLHLYVVCWSIDVMYVLIYEMPARIFIPGE